MDKHSKKSKTISKIYIRDRSKFIGCPGRDYRQGGFFSRKKGGEDFFQRQQFSQNPADRQVNFDRSLSCFYAEYEIFSELQNPTYSGIMFSLIAAEPTGISLVRDGSIITRMQGHNTFYINFVETSLTYFCFSNLLGLLGLLLVIWYVGSQQR